jgi:hypothetical protein
MATINLGAIKFNWKGAYNSGTTYAVDDVVSSGGNSYVCIQASTGNAVGNATAYWNIMSSAGTNGTNGTDLSTTLTTQSDLLYRDGSGLQRLPKGTANQLLRINIGATAPEWHTTAVATSDCVKLYSSELTSGNPSAINIQNCFSATYDIYKLYFLLSIGSQNYFEVGFKNSGGSYVGGTYYAKASQLYGNQTTSTAGVFAQNTTDGFSLANTWNSNSPNHADACEMTIYDPFGSANRTQAQWDYSFNSDVNGHFGRAMGIGRCSDVGSSVSLCIKTDSGDIENSGQAPYAAYVALYGMKK